MRPNALIDDSYPKLEYTQADFLKDTGNIRQQNSEERYLQKMQVSLTFQICFIAISGRSPIQDSDEPLSSYKGVMKSV
jgi:hypothetical protein